jgi:hypothetical protein
MVARGPSGTDETVKEPGESPADGSARPASAARETLSWIRALASQWEDDRGERVTPPEKRS